MSGTKYTTLLGFPLEENCVENGEEKEEESSSSNEEPEKEEKEEQEEEEERSSSEEEEEMDDDEPDPWKLLREKLGRDLKESYLKEMQRFLDRRKTQDYAEIAAFNSLLPVSRRRLRKTYLERLRWTHRIKHNVIEVLHGPNLHICILSKCQETLIFDPDLAQMCTNINIKP